MAKITRLLASVVVTFSLLWQCSFASFKFYDGLANSRVSTATYLQSAVTKIMVTVEVVNTGSESAEKYVLALPKALDSNLALVEVFDEDKNRLQFERESNIDGMDAKSKSESVFYLIDLPSALQADGGSSSQQLKATIAYIHQLTPLPAQIKKTSKQFVVYEAFKYFYSPYKTEKLNAKYIFPSDKFKSYTKADAVVDGKKISYGPFKDIEPFDSSETVRFHFQFHLPYLTMTEVVRDIEISHWGNVRIEESFLLQHDGAKLKGAYEVGMYDRYEHVMGSMASGDPSAVRSYKATLPPGATNLYYIDRIGNVSTSNFRPGVSSREERRKKDSVLEMRPRYPLFGGWKTDFVIGYDVPSADLISIDAISRVHTLNVSFGIPFKDPVTELLITRIALPEGAHDVKVICPYDIIMEPESKRFTYLDSVIGGGRPLITFSKTNVVNLHNEYFQITYVYDTTRIYYKPAMIILGIFTFFASIMTFARISPSLANNRFTAGDSSYNLDYQATQNGYLDVDNEEDRKQIEKIMKLKGGDDGKDSLKKLDKIYKKLKDERVKSKVDRAIQKIREITKSNSKKGGKSKSSDEADAKANVSNVLKELRDNL